VKSFLTWLLDSENLATAIVNVVRSFHTARKGTKFADHVGHKLIKMLSASRGLCHLTRGSAPGPRWELRPQTPIIGLLSALAMCSPPANEMLPYQFLFGGDAAGFVKAELQ